MYDLNLLNWFATYENEKPIWDQKFFEIKRTIDLEALKHHSKTISGDKLHRNFQHPQPYDFIEYYEYNDFLDGRMVIIRFMTIKNTELLTLTDLTENSLIRTSVHRHLIFISDLNNVEAINKRYELMQFELEKRNFMNLNPFEVSGLKTTLYPNQIHNVNFMVERENNLPQVRLSESRLLHFPDGRLYDYQGKTFVREEDIPLYTIRGGINFDEVGLGKTLQMLLLCSLRPCSTLIVVPDHLKQQWFQEMEKHFTDPLEITIKTFSEIKGEVSGYERIIVDEYHELTLNHVLFSKLCKTGAKYKWGVSGTAFNNISINPLFSILNFLTEGGFKSNFIVKYIYYQDIYKNFFVRNKAESIIELPECQIDNHLLDFTDIERNIYQAELLAKTNADIDTLRKICCDVILKFQDKEQNTFTKKQFMENVLAYFSEKMDDKKHQLDAATEKLESVERKLEEYLSAKDREELAMTKNRFISEVSRCKEDYEDRKRSYLFLKSSFEGKKEMCAICCEEIGTNYTILSCGHYFHNSCHEGWLKFSNNRNCAMCRKQFSNAYEIKDDEIPQQLYSTKLNELKRIVEGNNKTIIFTQFPDLIEKLQNFLNSLGINALLLDGNIEEKIAKFRSAECRVLILSSMVNSSGLNLQFCQNIVIFEPIKGDYVFLREVEKQVVGRIMRIGQQEKCNVSRLIIKDTIEEEIYSQYS
jgi:SNF2 family DNA or RNA helicase